MTTSTTKKSAIDIVNEKIISRLYASMNNPELAIPWYQPWMILPKQNGQYQKAYSGVNILLLSGCQDEFFFTWKQVEDMGGSVKEGQEKMFEMILNRFPVQRECHKDAIPAWYQKKIFKAGKWYMESWGERYYRMYAYSQTVGIPYPKHKADIKNVKREDIDKFLEHALKKLDFPMTEGSVSAFFNFKDKTISVPSINRFKSAEHFYKTGFHEIIHASGDEKHLNRNLKGFSKENLKDYTREELTAEIGASYLAMMFGIDLIKDQTVPYIQGWIEAIEDDDKLLSIAGSQAEKAVKFLMEGFN